MRKKFKRDVAAYYGLTVPGDDNMLVDMLGSQQRFIDVTLAHIWPSALMDVSPDFARELTLPADFHTSPRNYLLLPKDLHDAFDDGRVAFIPTRDSVIIRDFRGGAFSVLSGRTLHLPRGCEGRIPFKRLLSWFAWVAKGSSLFSRQRSTSVGASSSSSGNEAFERHIARGINACRFSRSVDSLTLSHYQVARISRQRPGYQAGE